MAETEDLFVAQNEKKTITSQKGQLQLWKFAVKVMKRLTQLKTCSLSQVFRNWRTLQIQTISRI